MVVDEWKMDPFCLQLSLSVVLHFLKFVDDDFADGLELGVESEVFVSVEGLESRPGI